MQLKLKPAVSQQSDESWGNVEGCDLVKAPHTSLMLSCDDQETAVSFQA